MTAYDILLQTIAEYKQLGIPEQVDYDKFYLYSLITHSTAIEGSTVTEIENLLLFDEGIAAKGRSMIEQLMNIDLKSAYQSAIEQAKKHEDLSIAMLCNLSALVMKNTGGIHHTMVGDFDSSKGDLRLVNVTAGAGGRSYMNYMKVPLRLKEFCEDINKKRKALKNSTDIIAKYQLSFDAHFLLVTIHPWVDGNGRMSRLIMNYIQFEFGLIPTKITKENKASYIQSLIDSREQDSLEPFRKFMFNELTTNLKEEIEQFKKDINKNILQNVCYDVQPLQSLILSMIKANKKVTRKEIATKANVSERTIAREIKKIPILHYKGRGHNGHWVIDEKTTNP